MPATVLTCQRMWEQLGGDDTDAGETFNVGYLVRLSEPTNMAPRLARAAVGYSRGDLFADAFPGEADADTSGMRCQLLNAAVRAAAPEFVDVTARFAVPTAKSGGSGGVLNPLTRPVVPEWVIDEESEELVEDVEGNKVVNVNGEPFSPAITRFVAKPTLRLRKNIAMAEFNVGWLFGICNKCNSDEFYGATPGQARIRGASATPSEENGVKFMAVQVEVAFREKGWREIQVRNRGRRAKVTWTNPDYGFIVDYQPILGPDGQPVDDPVDLDEFGKAMAPGGTPVYLPFYIYDETPFEPLGLA